MGDFGGGGGVTKIDSQTRRTEDIVEKLLEKSTQK